MKRLGQEIVGLTLSSRPINFSSKSKLSFFGRVNDWKTRPEKVALPIFCFLILSSFLQSCALTATRPVQEMSNTAAAIRAAKQVRADTLAPELFRVSKEWFYKARNEYRLKNFKEAKIYAERARLKAEKAEFQAISNGGQRNAELNQEIDPFDQVPLENPDSFGDEADNQLGVPDSVTYESAVEQRQAEADARARQQAQQNLSGSGSPPPSQTP